MHVLIHEPLPVYRIGVARRLIEVGPALNRHQNMCRRAIIRGDGRTCLAKSMRRAMWQTRRHTLALEPSAERPAR